MAYALAKSGSDWHEWQVRDVATGKDLPDAVQWSKFSGAAWLKDGSGFYYGRFDAPKAGDELQGVNQNQKLYFHKIGTPQERRHAGLRAARSPDLGLQPGRHRRRPLPARLPERRHREQEPHLRPGPGDAGREAAAVPRHLRRLLHGGRQRRPDASTSPTDQRRAARQAGRRSAWPRRSRRRGRRWSPKGPTATCSTRVTMLGDRFVVTWQIDARHALQRLRPRRRARARDRAADARLGRLLVAPARSREGFYAFTSFTYPSTVYPLRPGDRQQRAVPHRRSWPSRRRTSRRRRSSTRRRTARKIPMFITGKQGLRAGRQEPDVSSTATAASTSR